MPWWLPIYFLAAVTVTVLAFRDDSQDDEPLPFLIAELISSVLLFFSAFAYWFAPVRDLLGVAAPIVFVVGLSWTGISAYREFKKLQPDPEMSRMANAVSVVIGGALYLVLFSPLAYWGYLWAFQKSSYGA
jgi:glucose uptake protein GlcU